MTRWFAAALCACLIGCSYLDAHIDRPLDWDDAHFEDPNRLDVTRNTKKSLAFGAGPHFCAGAAASRSLIGDVALPMVFDRLDGLRLDESAPPAEFGGWAFRGPLNLSVTWN